MKPHHPSKRDRLRQHNESLARKRLAAPYAREDYDGHGHGGDE